jgi:hypothetical protein
MFPNLFSHFFANQVASDAFLELEWDFNKSVKRAIATLHCV